jgi:hypothetical protein
MTELQFVIALVTVCTFIGSLAIALYRVRVHHKILFKDDGSLNFITSMEYKTDMESISEETGGSLTEKEHTQLCKIAALEMKAAVGEMLDIKLEAFGDKLLKQLKLNGNGGK